MPQPKIQLAEAQQETFTGLEGLIDNFVGNLAQFLCEFAGLLASCSATEGNWAKKANELEALLRRAPRLRMKQRSQGGSKVQLVELKPLTEPAARVRGRAASRKLRAGRGRG